MKMKSTYGLYLYAPGNIFPKIKSYIATNYSSISVQGVSEFEFFRRDFLTNPSSRNLRSVAIVSTQRYSPLLADQYNAIVVQINSLQSLLKTKLIVTVLYVDEKVLPLFNPLRQYVDLNTAHIGAEGVKNDVIDKILIAPIIKDSPCYVEDIEKRQTEPDIQLQNPIHTQQREPISANTLSRTDVSKLFESSTAFTTTLNNIRDDLKNMELRMDVTDWTHQELESALETLGRTDSLQTIDSLLESKSNARTSSLTDKIGKVSNELSMYGQLYSENKESGYGEQVTNLVVYKDGLDNIKEICDIQNKNTLYRALQGELIHQGQKSIEEFQASLREIEDLKAIKDSKQRIEQMKLKRTVLIKKAHEFKVTAVKQYRALESEVNAQEKLLITKATSKREEYDSLQERYAKNSNEKLKNQITLDREVLVMITNEIKSMQESKKAFVTQFKQIMQNYEGIIALDTSIQKEYEVLTERLESTKKVVVEAKDNLGSKLDVVIGPDGAGKTCVAVNYAQAVIRTGKSVCIIDLDIETPEMYYYTENIEVQDIVDFLQFECSADGLASLTLHEGSCFIVNNFYGGALPMQLDNFNSLDEIYQNIMSKLSILAHVFDKIIVIARAEVSEFTNELYSRCGKWYYVTDLNPSNLTLTEGLMKTFKSVDSTTYYKIVLNKMVQTELSTIAQRLGINTSFTPIRIQFSHALTLSKLDGVIASASNNGLLQTFNFK